MIVTDQPRIGARIRRLSLGRYRHVALVLLLDLVLTAVFFNIVQNQQQNRTQAEFARQAETYVAAIQKGIERNLEVIESIGGLYAASGKVDRDAFRKFVQGPLSRHQEIKALSWNQRVTHSEKRQFEDSLRQEGYPEFQFKDWLLDGQRVVDIERPEYIVVTYIEPYESNQAALGFDVASNPARLVALERARDTGEMVTTARITLVQETGNQFGFLILKPIYKTPTAPETVEGRRQDLKGFAVGVFRIGDMVEAALEDLPKGIVNIQLVDEASPAGEGLLYLDQAPGSDNPADEEQLKARGEIYLRQPLDIPGRQWSLLISPTSEFLGGHSAWEGWGILAGGLLVTSLLVAYLIGMVNHASKTQRLADQLQESRDYVEGISQNLEKQAQELARSNQELEQFANIASHDLQEPLRMVSSYTQLLERRYKDKLDSDANEFIGYAVDGAKRMQTLINDLLLYSRITTQGHPLEATNCSDVFARAVTNLAASIEEKGAIVTRDPLPTVPADASQLVSVFQNLIGNGIKYHGDQPPRIHVSAVESGDEWLFSFKDNGIGIEAEFTERIFQIFQRLHSKAKYAGTGIGLAICKRVIERHGGCIWVESEPQKGSTFYFTLAMRNQQEEDHGGSGYHESQTNRDLVGGRQSR